MKLSTRAGPITSRALFTIVGGMVLINPAFSQEQTGEELEEVVVTGLRGSLKASMDTKRDAVGVVDAINAEDIGKFPDTNLREALQRITGISIDRRNGEGATVTARGFGPQFNMVTLNGRQMPTADAFADGAATSGGVAGNRVRSTSPISRPRHQRGRGVQDRPRGYRHRRHRCDHQRAHRAAARQRRARAEHRRQGAQRHHQSRRRRHHAGTVGHLQLRQRRQDASASACRPATRSATAARRARR